MSLEMLLLILAILFTFFGVHDSYISERMTRRAVCLAIIVNSNSNRTWYRKAAK